MKRALLALAAITALGPLGGCNKPTQEDCRQAISNMERILGTEAASRNADNEGEVRRCRGGSNKDAVACAIKAKTLDDLKACAFMGSKGKSAAAPSAPAAPTPSAPAAPTPSAPAAPTPSAPAPGAPAAPTPDTPSK